MINYMFRIILVLGSLSYFLICCQSDNEKSAYKFGSNNEAAVFHFNKGWEYILDYGQWTLSEQSFRKAVELDSNFFVGKSVLAKISKDLQERKTILTELKQRKHLASKDDQLLIDLTLKTVELFNARDENITLDSSFFEDFSTLGETNYREFVHKHPDESYMKAEYIEFIHLNKGAKAALDSLYALVSASQENFPFFISYRAILESDLGHFKEALNLADRLNRQINNPTIPEPHVLYAKIYSKMDSLQLAKEYIETAVHLDSNHVIAHRIKTDIDNRILEQGID